MPLLSIVVPCYNEAESLPFFYDAFVALAESMKNIEFEVIFIDDGSGDGTLSVMKNLSAKDSRVQYVSFSRNFGKEAAILAGLKQSGGDYVAVADADMQDPIDMIAEMYELLQGDEFDTIAARRVSRKGEPPIRTFFARLFYKIIGKISKTEIVDGVRDFRLMRRNVVDAVIELGEKNRFSKGIFAWVGFRTKYIDYENIERRHGETKWSFWGLLIYSIDGILSFSTAPLVVISIFGFIICLFAFGMMIFFILQRLIVGNIQGYAAMITIILFLGGIQLLGIGVLGQYLAKMFIEVKDRPIYIVRESSVGAANQLGVRN